MSRICPICQKVTADAFKPFCSRRCADIDLHRWLGGTYSVPTKDDEDEDGMSGNGDNGGEPIN
jgi:endogenous inhibitor of DNA gyrase (YacG/DUF329 family)